MEGKTWRRSWTGLAAVVLAGAALANAGCLAAAAGVAAGGVAGYAYYKGKVSQDYSADLDRTWSATVTALGELGMPVVSQERDNTGGVIESRTSTDDSVHITLDTRSSPIPTEGSMTRVGVRVGTFGDVALSERLLNQLGAHLVARLASPPAVTSSSVGITQPSGWTAQGAQTAPPVSQGTQPAGYVPQTAEPPLAAPATTPPSRATPTSVPR
jgi:hypothetical protein